MKWFLFVLFLLLLVAFPIARAQSGIHKTRVVTTTENDVTPIHTAMGYSTILQFDAKPTTAVLGDQDAFRVEYVGQSLTIKPLLRTAKTNLFVFTDYDRYNFQLGTVASNLADYIVKVQKRSENPVAMGSSGQHTDDPGVQIPPDARATQQSQNNEAENSPYLTINRSGKCSALGLRLSSISWDESSNWVSFHFFLNLDPKISKRRKFRFDPGDIAILQGNRSLPIETLFFDRLAFEKKMGGIQGLAVVHRAEIKQGKVVLVRFTPDFLKSLKTSCSSAQVKLSSQETIPIPRK